jgi:hypothetical protein
MLQAYLGLGGSRVIVAVRGGAEGSARSLVAGADASALCQVLLAFRLSDLDLLLLATAPQLLGLERVFCLELGPAVLGNVAVGHGCKQIGGAGTVVCRVKVCTGVKTDATWGRSLGNGGRRSWTQELGLELVFRGSQVLVYSFERESK